MFHSSIIRSAALGGALVLTFSGILMKVTEEPAAAQCDISGPNRDEGVDYANVNGLNIRTGPDRGCRSLGEMSQGTPLALWCYRNGQVINGNATWSYVRDQNRLGWVSNAYLRHGGSRLAC